MMPIEPDVYFSVDHNANTAVGVLLDPTDPVHRPAGSDVLIGELPGMLIFMSRDGLRGFGACPVCATRFSFDPLTVAMVSIDPETNLPPDAGGTDPQRAVRRPLCRLCVGHRVPFRRAANTVKPREAWLAQAHAATVALEKAEAATGRRVTSDAELYSLNPAAFHDPIEALHALEIDTGFRVADELMTLVGLTRLDTGWDIPDRP